MYAGWDLEMQCEPVFNLKLLSQSSSPNFHRSACYMPPGTYKHQDILALWVCSLDFRPPLDIDSAVSFVRPVSCVANVYNIPLWVGWAHDRLANPVAAVASSSAVAVAVALASASIWALAADSWAALAAT